MPRLPSRIDTDRNYRRGAIMGLTVAEAFMLIAFALLMLLALWRHETDTDRQAMERDLHSALAENKALERELARMEDLREISRLSPEARATLLEMADEGRLRLARVLDEYELDHPEDVREIARRLEMMEEADLRRLVEATTVWRAEERAQLLEFVALAPDEQSIADIVAILEDGSTPADIRRALALAARLDPHDMAGLEALREDIRERLGQRIARQQILSDATRAAIGELVAGLGGQIDDRGVITFPDDILFTQGSATPTPALRNFLAQACLPWFEAMQELGFEVREVRIEGHASSDWIGVSPEVAYFNNLNLSQQRAAAVLRLCLENIGATDTGRWARERATAVGYSSSRPIMDASGQEDSNRSRRVVFSASAATEDIFVDIGSAVSN
ncbi:OmpA family protein [Pararhodobacter sp. SW119]|uniref:OmpA/MotB family protein n=1 Tax=Pararhodobacter sp. SW119 TaxID=2780075 RepID=UPI001AE02CDC|nr:OmpA family protein [Pararhodobacter sp. SW119]